MRHTLLTKTFTPSRCAIHICIATSLILSGCRLGGKYVRPQTETPSEWKTPPQDSPQPAAAPCQFWWDVFEDPTLSSLEGQAVANSPNLGAAIQRVIQARAYTRVDRAALFPQLNLNPSYSNTLSLFQLFLPQNIAPFPGLNTPFRAHQLQYVLPLNLNYEIDLWGKLHNQYYSDVYAAESQGENFYAALLSLTGDVANDYYIMRMLDTQLVLLDENIALLAELAQLSHSRYIRGLVNEQAYLDADQQLTDAMAAYADVARQRQLQVNAIALLIGTPASDLELPREPLESLEPPRIPPGLPSEMLLRRPDIAAAERNMASQHALIGVAYASFFPSLSLTGTLGYLSPDFGQFLTWQSRLWSLGANVAQTIFDAGRNCANLDIAYARFMEAICDYEQQVLTAFREVEDALINLEWQDRQLHSYKESLATAQRRVYLVQRKYHAGYANNLDLMNAQLTELQARLNVVVTAGEKFQSTVQLIKALGGSWQPGELLTEAATEEPCCS